MLTNYLRKTYDRLTGTNYALSYRISTNVVINVLVQSVNEGLRVGFVLSENVIGAKTHSRSPFFKQTVRDRDLLG